MVNKEAKKDDISLGMSPKAKEETKRHEKIVSKTQPSELSKKDYKLESKPNAKDGAKKEEKIEPRIKKEDRVESMVKKDDKTETKLRAKDEPKKVSKTDIKVDGNVKPQSETKAHDDGRRKRNESRRSHPSPKRRRSRSRSPITRRPTLRRSRSRSPQRRARVRPRSRSPARSLPHHRKRSRSPAVQKRPPTPPKSPRIDKAQLLEFARQNLKRMQEMGSLPAGVAVPNQPTEVTPTSTQFTGKTVAELTDYCKHLMADRSGEDDEKSGKKESESTFTRHPFQIKPRSDTIVMNIRNAVALPVRKPEERVVAQAQLKQQFPVSSGQQHLDLEWIPVTPSPVVKELNNSSGPKQAPKAITASVVPTPRTPLPVAEPPSADIGSIVAQRISSIRKLQENQFDVQARLELEVEAESMTQNWATYHHTNPMTGEPIPELINWSGAPQAWVKKDLFTSAAPVASGVGMKLLQKMGWQPGEGLGRHGEGTLEPLSLDIKMDKKGLLSKEEMMGPIRATPAVKLIQEFQGKHPVSILHELCTKQHWEPPVFEQILDIGPDHLKHFLFKVAVNGIEYQACLASTTKKEAKAQSAAACLQALGVFALPPPGP
ncbi:SON protein [Daphnia magna]|uniref:SON protein n=1 Tax=Daphnia magna TaxID=35525 RepID=A0A164RID0_9CRUS|nr:SON protein [Daphnia magna]